MTTKDYDVKKFLITAAQYNAHVHEGFLGSLKTYTRSTGAKRIVLPMRGKYPRDADLDERLVEEDVRTTQMRLNKKIQVSNYNILPQQIDPVTGLARFTQSDVTTIFANPKQRMRVIPNSNVKLPKVLMSTGAVTHPYYRDDRIGRIAERDHTYGGVVVETLDDTLYHYRHITATHEGEFIDLGKRYTKDGVSKAVTEALVLGDWHVGDTDPDVRKATFDMIKTLKPKRIILHDFFNGHSVNHHDEGKVVQRSIASRENRLSLEDELEECYLELQAIRKVAGHDTEVVFVPSNHNEFLKKYLEEARFINDPKNTHIASKLLTHVLEHRDPLQEGLRMYGDIDSNVRFLKRDEDYKVRGWQLGTHGDKGFNGARSFSMHGKEYAFGKSITGHRHTPEILRNTYVVGTSTKRRLPWMAGPSSWMNTHAALYENGKVQLINIVGGKWKG